MGLINYKYWQFFEQVFFNKNLFNIKLSIVEINGNVNIKQKQLIFI